MENVDSPGPVAAPQSRRLIAVLGAAMFVESTFLSVLAPLLPSFVDDLGLTTSEAGLLSGAIGAGILVGALPAATLANRTGTKRVVVLGLVLLALASASFAIAYALDAFAGLVAARLCQGVAGAAVWVGCLTWVAAAADPQRRGAQLGTLIGIGVAGSVAGPLVGTLAIVTSPALVFGAVPAIACGLLLIIAPLSEPEREPEAGGLARLWSQPGAAAAAMVNLWFLVVPAMALGLLSVLGPLRLDESGAAAGLVGFVFLIAGAAEAAANPYGGRLADRIGAVPVLRVGVVAVGVLVALFAAVSGIGGSAVLIVAVGGSMGLFGGPVSIGLHSVLDRSGVGTAHAYGFFNAGFSGGFLVGAGGGGALADLGGDPLPCLLLAAAALLSPPLLRLTVRAQAPSTALP
jgi:DHA1 family solute carrier family 18 vesicular amine transporter 1/2